MDLHSYEPSNDSRFNPAVPEELGRGVPCQTSAEDWAAIEADNQIVSARNARRAQGGATREDLMRITTELTENIRQQTRV